MITITPEGILEAPIIRQGRTVSTASRGTAAEAGAPREGVGELCGARPDQASIHMMCEPAKLLSLCEINSYCLVQIILMVSCDSEINLSYKVMHDKINKPFKVSYR